MLEKLLPRSLSAKLVLAGGGAVTVILIATSLTTAWQTRARVEDAVLSQASAEAQGIANDIAAKLVDAGSAADAMTGSIAAVYGSGLHDRAVVVAMLKTNLERYPNVFGSWLAEAPAAFDGSTDPKGLGANAKGIFTPYWTKSAGSSVSLSTFDADYEKPWYKLAASSRKGAITEPYLSQEGVLMTSVAYPLLFNGKEIGVAGLDLRLETLSKLLGALKPFGDGRVMLVSSSGHWVAHPDAKLLTKPYAEDGAPEVTASLADGKPRILRGVDGGANARIVLPFQVPGLNATWATVMDVPEATFSTIADREMRNTIAMGLCMLLAVLAALYVATRLVLRQPLAALVRSVETLERGDYETPVAGQDRQDEAGALGRALEGFRHALADGHRNERLVGLERQKADLMRGETEAHHANQAAEQAHVVANLAEGLSRLSAGDLTTHLNEPFAGQYDALRVDFNATVATLGTVLQGVIDTAAAIRSGSGEISTAADDLSRRTEQQAASLEETAAALDEITATVRKTADGSKHARHIVGTATKHAAHSAQVVRQAVGAMTGIQASSREITQIIGVIDEIAFQTNLLALNAGVEAARAGDAGRGFAVVASEVRALAQRSAEAAKEIKTLISTSSQQVEQGVAFVGQTGEALAQIAAQVAEIDGIVGEMAASAHEQATGLDEVNAAVNQMDQVTQQNAAMVEQSTAASHGLARETEELVRLIAKFHLHQQQSPAGRNVVALAPAAGRRPPARPVPVATRGGAALKPRVEPAQALWEEF